VHQAGVGISATIIPTRLRAVTHLDVTDEDIEQAIEIVPKALGQGAALTAPIGEGRTGFAGAAE
jgi:hypothetical protein